MNDQILIKISIICSISGLALLYLASNFVEPALTQIEKIDQRDIGNSIKISGTILDVKLNPQGHVFLTIDDATGQIRASIFSPIAKKINSSLLFAGNSIELSGTLDEYKGQLQIIPKNNRDIKLIELYPVEISKISNKNSIVKIVGEVTKIYRTKENIILKVSDNSGSIAVLVLSSLANELELFGSKPDVDDTILIGGIFTHYRGTPQIVAKDIRIVKKETLQITQISAINKAFLNKTVKIEGIIAHLAKTKKGHIFITVKDDSGAISVLLFSTIVKQLKERGMDPTAIEVNDKIKVKGVVREYEGRLEVIPRTAEDVEF